MQKFIKMLKYKSSIPIRPHTKRKSIPMTAETIELAKAKRSPYMLYDTNGLSLHVLSSGNKSWKLKYTFDRCTKQIAFGYYPELSLADARLNRDNAHDMIAAGLDPDPKAVKRY